MANPVRIRGVDYPSQKAAGEALGVWPSTIGKALERGKIDRVGLGLSGVPVVIRGVSYPSMSAAARALGVHCETIRTAKRRGTLDGVGRRDKETNA